MKKLAILLAAIFLLQMAPYTAGAEEGTLQWPAWQVYDPAQNYSDNLRVRFRPIDNYICEQNPPDFSWWQVKSAESYEVIVCRDPEMTDIAYQKTDLKNNFYNWPEPFEPGTYYWSVRYRTANGLSVWQPARRFLVEDDAFQFPVGDMTEVLKQTEAKGHPRYYATKENLPALRAEVQSGSLKARVDKAKEQTQAAMAKPPLNTSLIYIWGDGGTALRNTFWKEVYDGHDRMKASTLAYTMTGDKSYADYAVKTLMDMAAFTMPEYDENTDSYTCTYAMNMATYYDVLYDLLSPAQRTTILNKIDECIQKAVPILFGNNMLQENPGASHEWNCGRYLLATTMLTLGEIPASDTYAEFLLPYYINQYSPHSVEDGSYRGGTGYWRFHGELVMEEFLRRSGIVNLFDKAYFMNEMYFPLYMLPAGGYTCFGDGGNEQMDFYTATMYTHMLNNTGNPVIKWAMNELDGAPTDSEEKFDYNTWPEVEPKPPVHMARAKYFKDGGFVAMHSDLVERDRTYLMFRSSEFGTYGHCNSDQNGFIIQAYGEPLAIDSGFYPYYMSPHHKNYAVQTVAHNSITYNGGKGQPIQDATAQGKITSFVTHKDFDFATGDATNAYKEARGGTIPNALEKAKRHILYVRPDMYIVIDDLAALTNETASFEFWLHAQEDLKLYEDRKGARITKGEAVLDASVQYPSAVVAKYIDGYAGPDMVMYPKEVDGDLSNTPDPNAAKQKSVYFATKPVNKTKMVTTLDVHKKDESVENMTTETFANYLKMCFDNGSVIYVNLTDGETITADNIQFNGIAAMKNEGTVMLAEGTELTVDGQKIFSADTPITAVIGDDELSISNLEKDAVVQVYSPGMNAVTEMKDEKIREIQQGVTRNGVNWTIDGDYATFKLYNGARHFYLNNTGLPGAPAEDTELTLTVDGVERKVPVKNFYDHSGNIVGIVTINDLSGFYYVEETNGVNIPSSEGIISVTGSRSSSVSTPYPSAKLRSMPKNEVTEITDFNAAQKSAAVWVEAENYKDLKAVSTVTVQAEPVYEFLSNQKLLQNLYQPGDVATYEITVPEDGTYDLLLNNVVYNSEADADMSAVIGDQTALFTLPLTNGPNGPNVAKGTSVWGVKPVDWHVIRVKAKIELKKGTYDLKLLGLGGGYTKFDWIGLIDSNK